MPFLRSPKRSGCVEPHGLRWSVGQRDTENMVLVGIQVLLCDLPGLDPIPVFRGVGILVYKIDPYSPRHAVQALAAEVCGREHHHCPHTHVCLAPWWS